MRADRGVSRDRDRAVCGKGAPRRAGPPTPPPLPTTAKAGRGAVRDPRRGSARPRDLRVGALDPNGASSARRSSAPAHEPGPDARERHSKARLDLGSCSDVRRAALRALSARTYSRASVSTAGQRLNAARSRKRRRASGPPLHEEQVVRREADRGQPFEVGVEPILHLAVEKAPSARGAPPPPTTLRTRRAPPRRRRPGRSRRRSGSARPAAPPAAA